MYSKAQLDKILELHRGYDLPERERTKGTVPIISSSGYSGTHNIAKCSGENVITGRYGTIGEVFYHNGECWPLNTALYVSDFKNNHPKYIYYLLKHVLKESVDGKDKSAVPGVNRNVLHQMEAPFCSKKNEQQKIVLPLETLDKKIGNNNAINNELEAMAQAIYDYWFLQFEFPDENGKPYKSSGGKMVWNEELKRAIPEGWVVTSLGSKCSCLLGGTPNRDKPEYWNGNINWINSGKINEFRISSPSETITQLGLDKTSTCLLPRNTVVLAITGATLGQVSILNIDSCANQSVVGILENEEIPTEYIYPFILNSLKQLLNQQTGAAQPHVNKNDIQSIPLIIPPSKVMKQYVTSVKSPYELIMINEIENQELASLRDFLLPLLMNGQVGFKD